MHIYPCAVPGIEKGTHLAPHSQFCKHKSTAVKQNPPCPLFTLTDYLLFHLSFSMWSELHLAGGDTEKSSTVR